MPNPDSIQNKINALKIYLENAPEQLTAIRDLCTELTVEINKYLQSQSDKRQYGRLDLILPVKYAFYKKDGTPGAEQSSLIRDISLGGAMVEMKEKPLLGASLILNLQVGQAPIQVKGRIRRIKEFQGEVWLVGVEFTEIKEEDVRFIFRFLVDNYG